MATVAVLHKVNDYEAWKAVFDEHGENRRQYGCTAHRVLRTGDDALTIMVLTEWPSMEAAQAWAADPSLGEAMGRAGVAGAPRIEFLEELEAREGADA